MGHAPTAYGGKVMQDTLEQLIDQSSLKEVLEALADICYVKQEHLRVNWQDGRVAQAWVKAGRRLEICAAIIEIEHAEYRENGRKQSFKWWKVMDFPSIAELVDPETYTSDFMGENF